MVSVIVPVYKVEPFLRRCVDSLLSQTYQNLEIILVDDGSPDCCGQICDEYAAQDARVKVIHKENGGISSARNAGLEATTGDYITFVDSDDWIEPWAYEVLRKLIREHDADIAEGAMRFYRPWKPERLFLEGKNTKKVTVYTNRQALEELYFGPQLFSNISVCVPCKLYRSSLMKDLRFVEGTRCEDVEFTPRALYYAKKIVKYDDTFYNYNIHLGADSFSAQKETPEKLEMLMEVRRKVCDFFAAHPVGDIHQYAKVLYANSMTHSYYTARRQGTEEGKRLWKQIPARYRKHYRTLKGNPHARSKRYLLFYLSPSLFYAVKRGYEALKERRKK